MATFGALRHPWPRLLHPYRTHVLCPPDLCPRASLGRSSLLGSRDWRLCVNREEGR